MSDGKTSIIITIFASIVGQLWMIKIGGIASLVRFRHVSFFANYDTLFRYE